MITYLDNDKVDEMFENGYVDESFGIFFRTESASETELGCRVFKM